MTPLLVAVLLAGSPSWPAAGDRVLSVGSGVGFPVELGHSLPGRSSLAVRASLTWQRGPRTGLEVEAVPLLLVEGEGNGPIAGPGVTALARFHLGGPARWRTGLDAGIGVVFLDEELPHGGRRTNFTPQIGLFAETLLAPGRVLAVGARLHHVSNGGRAAVNPGLNSAHLYLSVRFWRPRSTPAG